ncbi:hypothetical protein CONLIGDRAFT_75840 [Coniochaeta ligniaria NRRL 30616]|uniref:Uncharacterized protein n=1 Tax=Coniochaeta ligniaria NRRL 30616 TaxID=1408157 RepID=A0A1J7JBH2_9PEZI|nr:hypothetical protein CONLIGDRAFT_75840 [Coniochaeta ligniaria NRRL 30616]
MPKRSKRTTPGIPRWSPTRVLVWRLSAYLWESGRDPELSDIYGRTWKKRAADLFITGSHKRMFWRGGMLARQTHSGSHTTERRRTSNESSLMSAQYRYWQV